jgi:hypothetical protein
MNNKYKLTLEAIIAAALLLAAVLPSTALNTTTHEVSKEIPKTIQSHYTLQKAFIGRELLCGEGEDIQVTGEQGDDLTPAIVKDTTGNLWLFYVVEEGVGSNIYVRKSSDYGQTWPAEDIWFLQADGFQTYPVATVDSNGLLWVAFIDEMQDTLVFLQGQDPSGDPTTWEWWQFEPGDATYHKQLGSVTFYESAGQTVVAWCYIADIDFDPYGLFPEAATIEHNADGDQWTYTWDGDWQDIPSSHPNIGATENLFFFAFQYTDQTTNNERINVRWGDAIQQSDMEQWKNEWGMFDTTDQCNATKPIVSGSGSNAVVVYESDMNGNKDLLCSYTCDDGGTWIHETVVVNDVADEENPRVFVSGNDVYCLYTKEDNLYLSISEDNGATWGDALQVNDVNNSVETQWRTAEINKPFIVWSDSRNTDLDIYLDYTEEYTPPPHLTIKEVKGGLGVTTVITNDGDSEAEDVEVTITVVGGILGRINVEKTFNESSLSVGDELELATGLFLGLGALEITITAIALDANTASTVKDGTQLLIFTKVN